MAPEPAAPIVGFRTRLHTGRLPRPWGSDVVVNHVVEVRVVDADGAAGTGFSWTPTIGAAAVQALLEQDVRAAVLGAPADARTLWPRLWARLHEAGSGGITTIAMAGVDLALWDLAGRRAGRSLAGLLGRRRDRVEVYGSGVNLHYSLDELLAQVRRWVAAGFGAVKIKVGRPELAEDVDRVAAVREVLGPDRGLMIDANQRWDLDRATRSMAALEPFAPAWIEEPLRADDLVGHAELRRRTAVPVAMGENLHTVHRFRDALDLGAADVVQPNIVRVGGITPFLTVAALADERGVDLHPHLLPDISGQVALALDRACLVEEVEDAGLTGLGLLAAPSPVRVADGRLSERGTPGLGIAFRSGLDPAPPAAPAATRPGGIDRPARIVLVGVNGFGRVHAANLARLTVAGRVELVAAVDPQVEPQPDGTAAAFAAGPLAAKPVVADLETALGTSARGPVDVVVIAAPIGEHARLAATALEAGADVLLEKPPVATLADFDRLLELERRTGRVVQIGFQSLGAHRDGRTTAELFAEDAFGLGAVQRVGAVGAWSRTAGYWARSAWAGRRSLDGRPVLDGVVTNPLAHAVATACAIAGAHRADEVTAVVADLYRANPIESDDTSVVRVDTTTGVGVTCALTLCAPANAVPVIRVEGTVGQATLAYTEDRLELVADGRTRTEHLDRFDLLENLLAHRRDGTTLLVPLAGTGAFMRVLDAVASADPAPILPAAVAWSGSGPDRHPVVDDIVRWLDRAVTDGRTFAELGVPWARQGAPAARN